VIEFEKVMVLYFRSDGMRHYLPREITSKERNG